MRSQWTNSAGLPTVADKQQRADVRRQQAQRQFPDDRPAPDR